MHACLRPLLVAAALFPLTGCDKPFSPVAGASPAPVSNTVEAERQLVEARDALQRQALEIETKTALMDKQLAEMEQALKDRENAELRGSLEALKKQNDALRVQADTVRRQSHVMTQQIATTVPPRSVTPPVPAPRDYSVFYEKLAPHGRWTEVSGYGHCWQPTVATARWRPYVDGCWVWSSMGWIWQSNEPFGWATYHYGRWMNLSRHGWVWVPGSEWAPAWVSWRQGRDHVGWAPLPPDRGSISGVYRDSDTRYNLGPSSYVFIQTTQFVRPTYTTVFAPVTQNITIFQGSVNVTQIVRCDDRDRIGLFKHHGGPPRAQMERVCARPVPQIQVQSVAASQILPTHAGHRPGGALVNPVWVELPIAKIGAPVPLPTLVERIEQPRLMDAFEGLPQRVAAEIRGMISAEGLTAVVQRPVATIESQTAAVADPPAEMPAPVVSVTGVEGAALESVRSVMAIENKPMIQPAVPVPDTRITPASPATSSGPAVVDQPAASAPAMPTLVTAAEPEEAPPISVVRTAEPVVPAPTVATEVAPPAVQPVPVPPREISASGPPVVQAMPTAPAVAESAVPQQDEQLAQQRAAAERLASEQAAAAEAERALMQAEAAAMQQRQQEELAAQQRAMTESLAADQALAAAEAERARQQAEAAAMQRQQEEDVRQQQAMAQRQAEEQAHRAAEEQMRQQQEMAQREAEEQARRAAEEQMRQQQEMAQREAEEQVRRAVEEQMRQQQEMAQRQAEEQARRAAEEQMRQQQEMAQRQAEEQARRAAEEQMRQQQEMAQRQAEEQMRRAQEEAQRAAEQAARKQP